MGFGQAIKHVFSNYANFQGRASRSEFWWWYLFTLIVNFVLYLVSAPLGLTVGATEYVIGDGASATVVNIPGTPILSVIWGLAILIPMLAVGTRRLHDSGKSGWFWLFILLAPLCFIGAIILIILWILPSTPGPNKYGEGPATA